MKIKTIIVLILILLFTIFIYFTTEDKKVYYLNISDIENPYTNQIINILNKKDRLEKYVNNFSADDIRINDLINSIEENKEVIINKKKITLKNALIKADLITLSIGNSYLYYKINYSDIESLYDYIDDILKDTEKLFKLLKIYSKEKIIIFNYQSPSKEYDELFNYYNLRLDNLSKKYKIKLIYQNANTSKKIKKEVLDLLKDKNML